MVSILTGTVEPRNLEKDKKEEDEETVSPSNKYNENYRMDRYNAGVVFGTRSELAAVRLNMNCDRQLQKLCRVVEANRRQCQKQFGRWEGELEIRAETLHKLRIATKLNTEDYNRLQKLYESGRIRPVTAGTTPLRPRSSSYRVIAQKARQLRLGSAEPIRSRGIEMPAPAFASALAPTIKRISREGRSTRQSRLHPPLHFSGIIAGPMNDRLRVTVVRGFRRVAPLCWQQSLPGAITIPPVPVPLVSHILPASQVSPFVTNLHPLNPEYRLIPQPPSHATPPSAAEAKRSRAVSAGPTCTSTNQHRRSTSHTAANSTHHDTDYRSDMDRRVCEFLSSVTISE